MEIILKKIATYGIIYIHEREQGDVGLLFYIALMTLDEDDRDFVGELYEEHKKKIYEIAYAILKNRHDADEIVDEVMINVIKNVEKFVQSDGNGILAQLVIYTRNAAINLYNAKKRRAAHEVSYTYINEDEEGEYEDIEIEDVSSGIDDVLLSKENSEIVAKYLKELTQEQQDVIMLVFVLGYSNVEAAKVLGISPNAVGMRLYKAKKRLLEIGGDELREHV